jgi:RNA polymerase sigma-70 factor (ECF subfamily)
MPSCDPIGAGNGPARRVTWKDSAVSPDTLALARAGDELAFRQLTDPFRRELRLHCYRILGSLDDAEDMLQETLLAAWRGLADFEGRSSLRAWLYRIATNRCLNAVRAAGRRPRPAPVAPFQPPEPTRHGDVSWLQPYPDALLDGAIESEPGPEVRWNSREAVELAFIEALQRLPARQTAVVVLRDVLGFPTSDVATMLGTSAAAVKAALQRARATLGQHRPAARRALVPPSGSAAERDVTRRFADAFSSDDVDSLVALLTDDAWLAMPPAPHQYQGASAIADFLRASAEWRSDRRFRLVPTRANNQPAFGCYLTLTNADEGAQRAGLIVLTINGDRIGAITRFLDSGLFRHFGLPLELHDRSTHVRHTS